MNAIIGSLRDFFAQCPVLQDGYIHVDYLPEKAKKDGIKYDVEPLPAGIVVQPYMDGSAECQYAFALRSVAPYGDDVEQNIANNGLWEAVDTWLREQMRIGNMPVLPEGLTPEKVEVNSNAYPEYAGVVISKYQLQCVLNYFREGKR